jgi:hypothetical protein
MQAKSGCYLTSSFFCYSHLLHDNTAGAISQASKLHLTNVTKTTVWTQHERGVGLCASHELIEIY